MLAVVDPFPPQPANLPGVCRRQFAWPVDFLVPKTIVGEETGSFVSLPYDSRGASLRQAEAQLRGGAAQIVAHDPLASAEFIPGCMSSH